VAAETKLNGDKALIEACREGLDLALALTPVNLAGGGTCTASGAYGEFCPALADYRDAYVDFQAKEDKLYGDVYDAELALADTEQGIVDADRKIAATDRNDSAVQAQIDVAVAQYEALLPGSGADKRAELEASYDQEHQDAINKRAALVSLKSTQETAVTNAKKVLANEIATLPDPASVTNDGAVQCDSKTVDCAGKYQALCGATYNPAYQLISKPVTVTDTVTYTTKDDPPTTYTTKYTRTFSGQLHVDWADYENKKTVFESADKVYKQFDAMSTPSATPCAAASVDGKVIVWPSDGIGGARDILRRVDKRSVLQ
jgi:hypothetical protein